MAQLLPDPPPLEGARWGNTPLDYQQYRVIHESYLDRLEREGLVTNHRLSFRETIHRGRLLDVNFHGWVATISGGRLHVNDLLSVVHRPALPVTVQTREYVYHGRLVLGRNRGQQLFRYDNCHGDLESLHRHSFDVEGFEVATTPITLHQMPNLAEAVREAEYYCAFLRDLQGL